jgi:hypothetical protein
MPAKLYGSMALDQVESAGDFPSNAELPAVERVMQSASLRRTGAARREGGVLKTRVIGRKAGFRQIIWSGAAAGEEFELWVF